jgi:HEAT repeat protein
LNSESRIVSSAAAKALIKLKATEGKESLFRTLETGNPYARFLAAELIEKLKFQAN